MSRRLLLVATSLAVVFVLVAISLAQTKTAKPNPKKATPCEGGRCTPPKRQFSRN